ncbi:MAG: chorion class high-cysteine HCB protein 13 [Clostridia bacterium]|nr:chorion class high-cysteine HCB protein 13 [Clostridia bacterium]MBQ8792071.1 chorion class high-cysteine HCB protein 13 [Clostridia bacterium]
MNFFNNNNGCGGNFDHCGCGCDICSIIFWIILLQCLCGCGNNGGCGMDCCTLIILLLLCGCNNHCK